MGAPRVSLVVRCYNEREHIGKLLYGAYEQTLADELEVVVVDSGSTDGTLDVVDRYPVDEVVYIDPAEFSFGRALNYGCEAASGEFCAFTSAHAYPLRDDWLERLLAPFEDDDVALTYGKQRGNEATKFPERRVFRRWFPDEDDHRQDSPFCNNANAAIRRERWEEYPYDESLTGLEDLDWARRVREDGHEVSYVSDATVIHVHDETAREVYNRYRREAVAHDEIMPEREFTLGDLCRALTYNVAGDLAAAVRQGEVPGVVGEILRFRGCQFWGTYRGFNHGPITRDVWHRFFYPTSDPLDDAERGHPREIDYPAEPANAPDDRPDAVTGARADGGPDGDGSDD